MCAASAKTAAVTMPARWCEREVVRRVEAAVLGAVAPALPAGGTFEVTGSEGRDTRGDACNMHMYMCMCAHM